MRGYARRQTGNGRPRQVGGNRLCIASRPWQRHLQPRPVYGGPRRQDAKIWPLPISHGGSRGPSDPWSAAAASKRRALWFFRARKNDATLKCRQHEMTNPPPNTSPHAQALGKSPRLGVNRLETVGPFLVLRRSRKKNAPAGRAAQNSLPPPIPIVCPSPLPGYPTADFTNSPRVQPFHSARKCV